MFVALAPAQVIEDAGDDMGLGDCADDFQFAAAARTLAEVDGKHAIEPGHPAHRRGGHAGGIVTGSGAWVHGASGHNEMSVASIGRSRTSLCFAAPALPCAMGANMPW